MAAKRSATPVARAATRAAWRIEALTPERWNDFTTLFGAKGACAGCWCTWGRLTHAEFHSTAPASRRAYTQRLVRRGDPPGLIAYDDDQPVGWIAVAPRAAYRRYETSRVLAPVDEKPTWSVPCFFIARTHRGRGLTVALLRAACIWAAHRGARWIEGYPVDTRGARQAAAFMWTGLPQAFVAAGFREVERRSPSRPIFRKTLRAPRSVPTRRARGVRG